MRAEGCDRASFAKGEFICKSVHFDTDAVALRCRGFSCRRQEAASHRLNPLGYGLFRDYMCVLWSALRCWRGGWGSAVRGCRRVGQVLAEAGRNVGAGRGCGARQRFSELLLRKLAEQSAP